MHIICFFSSAKDDTLIDVKIEHSSFSVYLTVNGYEYELDLYNLVSNTAQDSPDGKPFPRMVIRPKGKDTGNHVRVDSFENGETRVETIDNS